VRGEPTAEELAALAAVVAVAAAAPSEPVERVRRGGWNDPAHQHRRPLLPGPNAWRASTW
jgi:poly(3-hydroxybutyrate) depolymerase